MAEKLVDDGNGEVKSHALSEFAELRRGFELEKLAASSRGRNGKRSLFCDSSHCLWWCAPGKRVKEGQGLKLTAVTQVHVGYRHGGNAPEKDSSRCFSISNNQRVVDFRAETCENRNAIVQQLTVAISGLKQVVVFTFAADPVSSQSEADADAEAALKRDLEAAQKEAVVNLNKHTVGVKKLAELRIKYDERQQQVKSLAEEVRSLAEENAVLQESTKLLQEAARESKDTFAELSQALERLQNENKGLLKSKALLQGSMVKLKSVHEGLLVESEQLRTSSATSATMSQQQHQHTQLDHTQVGTELAVLTRKLEQEQAETQRLRKELDAMLVVAKDDGLATTQANLQQSLDQALAEARTASAALQSSQAETQQLNTALQQSKADNSRLTTEVSGLQQKLTTISSAQAVVAEASSAQAVVAESSAAAAPFQSVINSLQQQLEEERLALARKHKELERCKTDLALQKEEMVELDKRAKASVARAAAAAEDERRDTEAAHQAALQRTKVELKRVEEELTEALGQVHSLKSAAAAAASDSGAMGSLQEQLSAESAAAKRANSEIVRLRAELAKEMDAVADKASEARAAAAESREAAAEVQILQQELARTKELASRKSNEVDKLNDEVSVLAAQIASASNGHVQVAAAQAAAAEQAKAEVQAAREEAQQAASELDRVRAELLQEQAARHAVQNRSSASVEVEHHNVGAALGSCQPLRYFMDRLIKQLCSVVDSLQDAQQQSLVGLRVGLSNIAPSTAAHGLTAVLYVNYPAAPANAFDLPDFADTETIPSASANSTSNTDQEKSRLDATFVSCVSAYRNSKGKQKTIRQRVSVGCTETVTTANSHFSTILPLKDIEGLAAGTDTELEVYVYQGNPDDPNGATGDSTHPLGVALFKLSDLLEAWRAHVPVAAPVTDYSFPGQAAAANAIDAPRVALSLSTLGASDLSAIESTLFRKSHGSKIQAEAEGARWFQQTLQQLGYLVQEASAQMAAGQVASAKSLATAAEQARSCVEAALARWESDRTALEQIEERARAKAHAMSVDEESFLSTIAGLKKKVGSLEETVEDLAAALREAREELAAATPPEIKSELSTALQQEQKQHSLALAKQSEAEAEVLRLQTQLGLALDRERARKDAIRSELCTAVQNLEDVCMKVTNDRTRQPVKLQVSACSSFFPTTTSASSSSNSSANAQKDYTEMLFLFVKGPTDSKFHAHHHVIKPRGAQSFDGQLEFKPDCLQSKRGVQPHELEVKISLYRCADEATEWAVNEYDRIGSVSLKAYELTVLRSGEGFTKTLVPSAAAKERAKGHPKPNLTVSLCRSSDADSDISEDEEEQEELFEQEKRMAAAASASTSAASGREGVEGEGASSGAGEEVQLLLLQLSQATRFVDRHIEKQLAKWTALKKSTALTATNLKIDTLQKMNSRLDEKYKAEKAKKKGVVEQLGAAQTKLQEMVELVVSMDAEAAKMSSIKQQLGVDQEIISMKDSTIQSQQANMERMQAELKNKELQLQVTQEETSRRLMQLQLKIEDLEQRDKNEQQRRMAIEQMANSQASAAASQHGVSTAELLSAEAWLAQIAKSGEAQGGEGSGKSDYSG